MSELHMQGQGEKLFLRCNIPFREAISVPVTWQKQFLTSLEGGRF